MDNIYFSSLIIQSFFIYNITKLVKLFLYSNITQNDKTSSNYS